MHPKTTAITFFLLLNTSLARPQTPPAPPRPTSHQSVTVSANLTPEEIEEGKLNDLYQPASLLERQGHCDAAIEKYRSVVLPEAQKAKFDSPRNKFLYLATQGIASCDISAHRYEEAEALYQKCLDYIPVWPGLTDSDYPITLRSVGLARLGRQDWKGAEEILQKSVAIFDQQIERAVHSDSEFMHGQMANNLRMSQDSALSYLAVARFRQDHPAEALEALERAYQQATKFNAPAATLNDIIETGRIIALSAADLPASATWLLRSKSSN